MLLSDVCLCVCLEGLVNIVEDARTSLIFINLLVFMVPTAIGSKAMDWRWATACGVDRVGRGRFVLPRAQLV